MLVMQEKVYVDTSSLIILNKINALDLLNKIYSNVIITNYIQLELNEAIPSWISVELTYNIDQSFLLTTTKPTIEKFGFICVSDKNKSYI